MPVTFGKSDTWHHTFGYWLEECLDDITLRMWQGKAFDLENGPGPAFKNTDFYIFTTMDEWNRSVGFFVVSETLTEENRCDPHRKVCWGQLNGGPSLKSIFIRMKVEFLNMLRRQSEMAGFLPDPLVRWDRDGSLVARR